MAAKSCDLITDFYCSSDDDAILNAANQIGYKKIIRPAELALPTSQHVDAIIHALAVMRKDGCEPDVLVAILANNCVTKKEWVDEAIRCIINDPSISATIPVMEEMDHHPYRSKRLDENGFLTPWFDFNGKKISTNRQDLPKNYILCHNFWVLNLKNTIYSKEPGQQPWTFVGNKIKPIIVEESFDVHDLEDIKRTEKWLIDNNISY